VYAPPERPSIGTRSAIARRRRTRLTPGLAGLLFVLLLLFGGALQQALSPGPVPRGARLLQAALAAFHLMLVIGLVQMRPAARHVASATFAYLVFSHAVMLSWGGIDSWSWFWLAMLVFAGGYLLLPSTATLFEQSAGLAVDRTLVAPVLLLGVLLALSLWALLGLGWSPVAGRLIGASAGIAFVALLASPLYGRLISLLGHSPPDLDGEEARAFRSALWARFRGDAGRAEALVLPLPVTGSVAALRGILAIECRHDRPVLDRVVMEASFLPKPDDRLRILDEIRAVDIVSKVAFRTQVVDALVNEAVSPGSLFGHEAVAALERITGALRLANTAHQLSGAWQEMRPRWTDGCERRWLAARLLGAGCPAAAAVVLERASPAALVQGVHVARLLDEGRVLADPVPWLEHHALELVPVPELAEGLGLLRVDAAFPAEGLAAVGDRLEQRVPMIDALNLLWQEYDGEVLPAPWILPMLTGYRTRFLLRSRFERWWDSRRAAQEERDRVMAEGLRWASFGDWEAAAHGFASAVAIGESPSASYDLAFCWIHLGRSNEAVDLLTALTARDARNGASWSLLAEAYRRLGHEAEEREARERAAGLLAEPAQTQWKARLEALDQADAIGRDEEDDGEGPSRVH
jgi:hypothetical protein